MVFCTKTLTKDTILSGGEVSEALRPIKSKTKQVNPYEWDNQTPDPQIGTFKHVLNILGHSMVCGKGQMK